jgi:hypothetical protein
VLYMKTNDFQKVANEPVKNLVWWAPDNANGR